MMKTLSSKVVPLEHHWSGERSAGNACNIHQAISVFCFAQSTCRKCQT